MSKKMSKKDYISNHPKSYLAAALRENDWTDDTEITVVGGLEAPDNPRSNLASALADSKNGEYVRGGHRQHGTEGWWFAVA